LGATAGGGYVRKLIGVIVVLAIIVAGLGVLDVWSRHRVQSLLATHVESQFPGSSATVAITSFPFLGRLVTWTTPGTTSNRWMSSSST
jgi:hypothetical protein